jgi:hypothetical protein
MFLLSHPSLEESKGWGTPDHGRTKMKNMGAPPARSPGGVVVHWVRNTITGEAADFKLK